MVVQEKACQIDTKEILDGFLYSYRQLDTSAVKLFEASAHLYALIDLLVAKGIISREELDEHTEEVKERLNTNFKEADIGVRVRREEVDKYAIACKFRIDCESRISICHAACCSLAYPLTMQDIKEGIRWSLGQPFLNARGQDGYCVHWEHSDCLCSIYENRPAVCREYDCRQDKRIWLDFDKMVINPELPVKRTH